MSSWPDKNELLLKRFVDQLKLRSYGSAYESRLRHFQRSVSLRSARPTLTQAALRAWLRKELEQSSKDRVVHYAQLVNRFLEWLVERAALASNPLTELRRKYECRSTAAVVRALISARPNEALDALRPLPRYGSHLGTIIREHVHRMQTLGLRYDEHRFLRFDCFLQRRPGACKEHFSTLVAEYAAAAHSTAGKLQRINLGRVLARALSRAGYALAPAAEDRTLAREVLRARRRPYIYTIEEVRGLLQTARHYPPSRRAPLRPVVLYTMLVLAYCAGLRLGEIAGLQLRDIDLGDGTIQIRDTKFFKSRLLPLSLSALAALRDYLQARSQAGAPAVPDAPLFWHQKGGYSSITAGILLRRVIRLSGLGNGTNGARPRVHDLRHTMVVHRMTAWYKEGMNPQDRLPYLSAYLGHKDINSTLVYLTITQELLQNANDRFRVAEADVLKVMQQKR